MRRRLIVTAIASVLIAFCAFEAWQLWPAIRGIERSASPLEWWTLMILFVVVLKLLLFRTARGAKRFAMGQCLSCGCDLHEVKKGSCPNCGKPVEILRAKI